jgi:hypothetical protein
MPPAGNEGDAAAVGWVQFTGLGEGQARVRPSDIHGGRVEGVGLAVPGVGGVVEGVGGAVEGVGGAVDGVGGAIEGVGGAVEGVGDGDGDGDGDGCGGGMIVYGWVCVVPIWAPVAALRATKTIWWLPTVAKAAGTPTLMGPVSMMKVFGSQVLTFGAASNCFPAASQ